MNELKIGDRVKVISVPNLDGAEGVKIIIGMTGTVKLLGATRSIVEFDNYDEYGHCWSVAHERLEKIEETEEETDERKPYIPKKYGEDYFFLSGEYDGNKNVKFRALQTTWTDNSTDYGMLVLGNVFRNEEEALKNKDKLLEKMERLREGEQI